MRAWPTSSGPGLESARRRRPLVNGHPYRLRGVDCGELLLPSGRLAVCDPFAGMRRGGNPAVQVRPGRYRVRVTLAEWEERGPMAAIRGLCLATPVERA